MKRKIIKIDEEKCTGCGMCLPNCPEGAIQIIDDKARLVSDLMCDGLGACLGTCPEDAITIEEREAEPYDEVKVMEQIVRQGEGTLRAHLEHLQEHGEETFLAQARAYLSDHGIADPTANREKIEATDPSRGGCPGARAFAFQPPGRPAAGGLVSRPSQLSQWPIQLHLIAPHAPHFRDADLLIAADCTAFAVGDFHDQHLQGKKLAIACPKLDHGQEMYREKLVALIDQGGVRSLTVMIMDVPCCSGLLRLVKGAVELSRRNLPIKALVVGLQGELLEEEEQAV